MFFIDAASFIDVDDDSWRFFMLFEKVYNQQIKLKIIDSEQQQELNGLKSGRRSLIIANPSGEGGWSDEVPHSGVQHGVRVLRLWQGGQQEEAKDCPDGIK